ncbi:hypothetical protein HanPSC8_Chr09g0349491 [Helianthus annuus]|nr:hypothetical protein HanPSC8_Chr09g0349491 [Helianthus annuus]
MPRVLRMVLRMLLSVILISCSTYIYAYIKHKTSISYTKAKYC